MEQVADAAAMIGTGAILAHEAERVQVPGHDPSPVCANCGSGLNGPYCSTCGQHGHVHRTAGAFFHDVLHGVFHFEGKFWATLPLLAWRPGDLTRRYAQGERAKFVSPMALFLFSVFLTFAVVANLPGWHMGDGAWMRGGLADGVADARGKIAEQRIAADKDVAGLTRRLVKVRARGDDPDEVREIARDLARAREAQVQLGRAQQFLPPTADETHAAPADANWFEAKYRHAKQNPQLLLYKLKSSAYKYSWALIPISLPFIWLLFPLRRDVGMYDHAVFATYSLSFMSLLLVVLAVLEAIGLPAAICAVAATLIPPLHIYRQLKGAYGLGRAGALWRTAWMLTFAVVTSTLFMLLLVYLGTAD